MRLRNGDHGHGAVTKTLHWLTVGATTPLPPWAPFLSVSERHLESLLEKLLLALLFLVPATGLLLVFGDLDWLGVHIAAQLAFLLTIAVHAGLVLRHTVLRRDGELRRML